MNTDEEILNLLKQNELLQKKQLKASRFRNILLVILVLIFLLGELFIVRRVNEAMITIEEINNLTEEIQTDLQELDLESLNNTISNLEDITTNLDESITNFNDVTKSFTGIFR